MKSYPDTITNPVGPPRVNGMDVERDIAQVRGEDERSHLEARMRREHPTWPDSKIKRSVKALGR